MVMKKNTPLFHNYNFKGIDFGVHREFKFNIAKTYEGYAIYLWFSEPLILVDFKLKLSSDMLELLIRDEYFSFT
jgi:hypothetical protein